ncbi:MAG TPA: hypothetical protein VG308_21100 [Stellaceae bacterium]|nr:hypothetical protein [Stellaceae bacterium]
MNVLFAVAIVAIATLPGSARAARSWLWCETSQAYWPWVRSCTVPWRRVDPRSAAQQPYPAQQRSPSQPAAPLRDPGAGEDGGQAAVPPQNFPARGDDLDAWCRGVTTALNVAQCGDDALRALAIERLHAFDEASARLAGDRRKVLAADQNGWAMAYPQGCGLPPNVLPALPLAPSVKACLLREGRARLAYLRNYGGPAATGATAPETPAPAPSSPPVAIPPAAVTPQPAAASPRANPSKETPPANGDTAGSRETAPPASQAPAVPLPPAIAAPKPAKQNPARADLAGRRLSLAGVQGGLTIAAVAVAAAAVLLWILAALWPGRRRS